MSAIDDTIDETAAVPLDEERGPFSEASVVDLLKQEIQELAEVKDVLIKVEGYDKTGLQVKYGLPENGKQLDTIARKVQREFKGNYERNLYIAIDTMIALCMGLYVQPPEVDEPVMLDPDETGTPVQFDERLAELVGLEDGQLRTARNVVRRLFRKNDMAIVYHAEKLNRWLQNTNADLDLEIWQLGE